MCSSDLSASVSGWRPEGSLIPTGLLPAQEYGLPAQPAPAVASSGSRDRNPRVPRSYTRAPNQISPSTLRAPMLDSPTIRTIRTDRTDYAARLPQPGTSIAPGALGHQPAAPEPARTQGETDVDNRELTQLRDRPATTPRAPTC